MFLLVLLAVLPSPEALRQLPVVADVQVRSATGKQKVVHICDWHWISRKAFVLDGGDEDDYEAFLDDVAAVQEEQIKVLRALGVKKSLRRRGK